MARPLGTYLDQRPYYGIFELDPLLHKFDWNHPLELHKRKSTADTRAAKFNTLYPNDLSRFIVRRTYR